LPGKAASKLDKLRAAQLEGKIGRETDLVALYRLVESFGRNAVKPRKIGIEQHPVISDSKNQALEALIAPHAC